MEDWSDWQKSYLNGVLLIMPPADIAAIVNPLRETYDPISQSYCTAHISLTPTFRSAPDETAWQALSRIAGGFPCIDIVLGPPKGWLHQSVIYLNVQGRKVGHAESELAAAGRTARPLTPP
jgi:hypothetical protein